ncbi:hypothetical protein [Bacillus kexueae]|uniref:hypothetical protein n=1 Tax=Aeribacillus kexueae TaxID=2078952 RepID=UPI001FAFD53B|nr:hypothetical protein [Bacillus kexueae]
MKRLLSFFLIVPLMGCQYLSNDQLEEQSAGLEHTNFDESQTSDELLLESRRQVRFGRDDNELETREAERLVSNYVKANPDDTVVQYDHKEGNRYILRVYSVDGGNKTSWYSVDLETKKVEKLTR